MKLIYLLLPLALPMAFAQSPLPKGERVTDGSGASRINYLPMPKDALNPWSKELEDGFWKRADEAFSKWNFQGKYGGTFFESEKSSYPRAFIDFVEGNREPALKFLQELDSDKHAQKATMGVDWFPSFTIKSQVRKYFFFGQYLEPEYRKRMFDSARKWTEIDPMNRPNDFFEGKKEGWNVESKNSWVDVRGTDNLRAMRDTGVYLMAEETGNRDVAAKYKENIRAYVNALYMTGMGEWDSANYFGHAITAYIQLYDFAKDPEVRLLGKAALDWFSTAAAVKYFRGNWAGPNKRDYNNIPQFVAAPGEYWLYFGDTPRGPEQPAHDLIHMITSPYRPPQAVVGLARKDFKKPVEILASKPTYDGWIRKPGGEDAPEFFETTYISQDFQVGTLSRGHQGDANGFRMASTSSNGSNIWVLSTAIKPDFTTASAGGDQIAQHRNVIISANSKGDTPFYFLIPKDAEVTREKDVTFIKSSKAWAAVRGVNTQPGGIDAAATREICEGKRPLPDNKIWSTKGTGGGPGALVLEIGDALTGGNFAAFRSAVLEKGSLDVSKPGEIHYRSGTGPAVGIRLTDNAQPVVFRDGKEHDFQNHFALYACTEESASQPISLGWREGVLTVRSGGGEFVGRWSNGRYSFENK